VVSIVTAQKNPFFKEIVCYFFYASITLHVFLNLKLLFIKTYFSTLLVWFYNKPSSLFYYFKFKTRTINCFDINSTFQNVWNLFEIFLNLSLSPSFFFLENRWQVEKRGCPFQPIRLSPSATKAHLLLLSPFFLLCTAAI
jgi:hypothetical protein